MPGAVYRHRDSKLRPCRHPREGIVIPTAGVKCGTLVITKPFFSLLFILLFFHCVFFPAHVVRGVPSAILWTSRPRICLLFARPVRVFGRSSLCGVITPQFIPHKDLSTTYISMFEVVRTFFISFSKTKRAAKPRSGRSPSLA